MDIVIKRACPFSQEINSLCISATNEQIEEYYKGEKLIQDVFPSLTPDEREFIKTGITADAWNKFVGGDDIDE